MHASTESEVRALLDRRSEAIRAKDVDRLVSLYTPDIVYFDIVPPLRYAGSEALRGRFSDWFARWQSAVGQEIRDLSVVAGGDIAAAHMLIRASGTLKDGREVGYWVRTTDFCPAGERRVADHTRACLTAGRPPGRPGGHGPRTLTSRG